MKSAVLATSFFFFFLNIIAAQEKIPDFGKIDISELNMKECAFEKDAGAMNLIRTAKIGFDINGFTGAPRLSIEYRSRIKIFNERGYSAANIKIPYISKGGSSKITDIEAFIYFLSEDGKIIKEKVEKKEMFNEKGNARTAFNYVAFTFPNLKNGSVIEYKYTKIDKNSLRIEPWFFQDLIPTAFSKVSADIPAYLKMTYHVLVSDSVEKETSYKKYYHTIYNEEIRSFGMHNIHSFKVEPLMGSLKDNLQRVEFSLNPNNNMQSFITSSNSRMMLYNFYLLRANFFGMQFDKALESTEKFMDSVKKLNTADDKIAAVYKYLQRNVEWNGELTFYCDSLEGCIKNKTGSNAEMNILLLNLLRKAGIKCFPILISTRENGNPDQAFGNLSQFNGVNVMVRLDSGKSYIIDCTQKNLSFKIPPFNVLNSNAYLVDPNLYGWIFITDPRILMKNECSINAQIDSNGNIKGTMNLSFIGFAKSETLAEMKKSNEKIAAKESDRINTAPEIIIDTIAMERNTDNDDTLKQRAGFRMTLSNTDKIYFLNPFMFSSFRKNPFRDSTRFSDIDFGCNQSYYTEARIKIPESFSVESLPNNTTIQMQDSNLLFRRQFLLEPNYIVIHNSFVIKNSFFFKEDYQALKSFFSKFYGLLNEEILLKKKK